MVSYLRDRYGKLYGIIRDEGDKLVLYDRIGRFLGSYVKVADETRDRFGRVVAKGNWLSALLYKYAGRIDLG